MCVCVCVCVCVCRVGVGMYWGVLGLTPLGDTDMYTRTIKLVKLWCDLDLVVAPKIA